MRQFDIHRNPNPDTASWAPYLLIVQSDLLRDLQTAVVAPLVRERQFGRPAVTLNPLFHVDGERVVLSVAELAGVSRQQLGNWIGSLAARRDGVIGAIDLLFTGV